MTTPAAVRPVVAGIDGSDHSLVALRWAAEEARRRSAPLWVVHAFDLLRAEVFGLEDRAYVVAERHAAEKILDAAVRQARALAGDVEVRPLLETGTAPAVLLEQSAKADLVVLGSRGRGEFAGLLLGSTSLHVATHASGPVVVVRRALDETTGPSAGRVVVGTDGSPHSERALRFAFEHAQERGVGVTAVRALLPPTVYISTLPLPEWRQLKSSEQAALAESVAPWREKYPGVDVVTQSVVGEPAKVLIDESAGAELLVVGSHGRGGFAGLLLGSVSHAALHHAHCPVAVVRH
jgi:nucleotide-binding universal stress UspA family protein